MDRTRVGEKCDAGEKCGRLGCVVMANGEARRFGRQKLLEPLDGKAVVLHALDALFSPALDVVVVSRWPEVRRVCAEHGAAVAEPAGPLQSDTVRAGVRALGPRVGYLFAQGDQPLLSAASVDALVGEFMAHPGCVARLAWHGEAGSPVVFPGALAGALCALSGDVGGGALLCQDATLARGVRLVEARRAAELMDVDTPKDLARVAGELGRIAECM